MHGEVKVNDVQGLGIKHLSLTVSLNSKSWEEEIEGKERSFQNEF